MRKSQLAQTYKMSNPVHQKYFEIGLLVMMFCAFLFSTSLNAHNTFTHDEFGASTEEFTNCNSISLEEYTVVQPTCGESNGTISFTVNNPNNYCLVYRLYNYNTSSWATDYQSSKVFDNLSAAQYRVKMYVDYNCNVNNPNVTCYTPSAYQTLTCTNGGSNNNTDCTSTTNSISGFIYLGEYNGSKYFCSENNKTWNQAISLVQANGGHIAVVNDAGENNFLKNNIQASVAWIGYTDSNSEGNFYWHNGENSSYTNWVSSEPNDDDPEYNGADYAVIQPDNGKWYDRNGSNAYEVVMEIPCGITTPSTTCYQVLNSSSNCTGGESAAFYRKDCYGSFEFWKASSDLRFTEYSDNTARMQGHITNNGSQGYVDIYFSDKSSSGPIYNSSCYTTYLSGAETHYNTFQGTITVGNSEFSINTRDNMSAHLTNGAGNDGSNNFGMAAWSGGSWGSCGEIFANFSPIDCSPGTGSIGNFVFNDKNGNGIQDNNEPGINNVTVMLLDSDGNMIGNSQITTNGGQYQFTDVPAGDYKIKFTSISEDGDFLLFTNPNQGNDDDQDSDAVQVANTNDAMTSVFTLNGGDNITNIDAGLYQPAKIGNFVFEDNNGDGILNGSDAGINNVTVMLLDTNGDMVQSSQTTINGFYSFENVPIGSYKVKFTTPIVNGISAILTQPNQGNDDTKDSDAIEMVGTNNAMTAIFEVNEGENNVDIDAGYYFPAKIGDYVWDDANLNGIQDETEDGIPGVLAELRNGDGTSTGKTTTTNNDGKYEFVDLIPGEYKIVFPTITIVNNVSYILTSSDAGGDDTKDSDPTAMAIINEAMSPVVTLESGDDNDSIDAGYFKTASVGDKAFNDRNQNGLQDNNDSPLQGVTVMLIGKDAFDNTVNQTVITNGDGEYLFENVVPGTYELKFTPPITYIATGKDVLGNEFEFADSDIDPLTGKTDPVTIDGGEAIRNIDAGFFIDPALPVALTSFEAQLVNNSEVVLKWATASEEDNSHFVVERSADGRDFQAIGTVTGNGTTNQINRYSLLDKDPYYGYNYYRLRQVDFDGDYEFSKTETVIISSQDVPDVIIYPNPVVTTTTLRVVTPFETYAKVEVVDQSGKVLLNIIMNKGANSKQIDMALLSPGIYFAYINYNGHRELIHKIVKVEE